MNALDFTLYEQCFFRDPDVAANLKKMEAGVWVLSSLIIGNWASGHVVKCFHDVYPDYDELRQVTLSVCFHLSVFSVSIEESFCFRLFKHLCLGGELCQYEDTIDSYIKHYETSVQRSDQVSSIGPYFDAILSKYISQISFPYISMYTHISCLCNFIWSCNFMLYSCSFKRIQTQRRSMLSPPCLNQCLCKLLVETLCQLYI
uniref:Cilia- and flagella-associated protein 300 n=1 Tax=Seriola dumerili TaxID=41447 RepID=A0A3B4U5T1_SERDU